MVVQVLYQMYRLLSYFGIGTVKLPPNGHIGRSAQSLQSLFKVLVILTTSRTTTFYVEVISQFISKSEQYLLHSWYFS